MKLPGTSKKQLRGKLSFLHASLCARKAAVPATMSAPLAKTFRGTLSYLILGLLLASAAGQGAAQTNLAAQVTALTQQHTRLESTAQADSVLQAIVRLRGLLEEEYAQEEKHCFPKFFAASCLEQAAEKRRRAMDQLRPLEVEAERFKRAASLAERDAELDKKQRAQAEELPRRIAEQQAKLAERQAKEERLQKEEDAAKAEQQAQLRAADLLKRQLEAEARAKERAARQPDEARERAAKEAEFAAKQAAAAQRQQELEKRQKAKQEKAAAQARAKQERLEKEQARAKAALGK